MTPLTNRDIIATMIHSINWPKYRFLVFDLDGTLIDSSRGVVKCTNYALAKHGDPERPPDEIKRFIGYPLDEMFPVFSDAPVEQLKAAFHEMSRKVMIEDAVFLPNTGDVLDFLHRQGYIMAVATTKYSQNTRGLIERFNWTKYFKALASGDEVPRVKPAPDLIYLALERISAPPDQTVMIGDTVNDVQAARNAGVKAIVIRSPFGNDDVSAHNPELILDNILQLKEIFRKQ